MARIVLYMAISLDGFTVTVFDGIMATGAVIAGRRTR